MYICVCIAESLFCTAKTNTILLSNYTPINFFLIKDKKFLKELIENSLKGKCCRLKIFENSPGIKI